MSATVTHNGKTYVSKTSNKIKQRDLDPDFLMYLLNNSSQLDIPSLLADYRKKSEIIPENLIDAAYRAGVQQDIEDLQSETSKIKSDYRRSAVAIGWDDLTDELQLQYQALWTFIDSIKTTTDGNPLVTFDENGYKQITIQHNNQDYQVVVPTFNSSGTTDEAALLQLRNRVYSAETKVEALEAENASLREHLDVMRDQISDLYSLYDNTPTSSTGTSTFSPAIQNIQSDISVIQSDIASIQESLLDKLSVNTAISDTQISTAFRLRVLNLEEQVSGLLASNTNSPTTTTVLPTGYLFVNNDGQTTSRDLVITACVCGTAEEVVEARFRKELFIIDLTNGQGQRYLDNYGIYSENFAVCSSPDYDGFFIYDTNLGALAYYIHNGECLRISGGALADAVNDNTDTSVSSTAVSTSVKFVTKDCDLSPGGFETVQRTNNMSKLAPSVLILDHNDKSTTYNKYINSEGMITVAHAKTSFTVYNSSSERLSLRIIYVN